MASVRENRNFVGNSRKHSLENIHSPGGELSIRLARPGSPWCRRSAEPPPRIFGSTWDKPLPPCHPFLPCAPHVHLHMHAPCKPPPATSTGLPAPSTTPHQCPSFANTPDFFPTRPMAELEAVHPSQAAAGFSLLTDLGFGVKFPNFNQKPPPRARNGENWPL